jgi:hypothetical protein
VTEAGAPGGAAADALGKIAHASGHELRNTLNALVVNLEVVRARTIGDATLAPFVAQAIEQSEASVRLAEGAVSLLALVASVVSESPGTRVHADGDGSVTIAASAAEGERVIQSLRSLAERASISAEYRDAAVILTVPRPRNETNNEHE